MKKSRVNPRVTVLMPVLNPHPEYFPVAIKSVLDQTYEDFELLVVEDPSCRSAREHLAEFDDPRIVHVRNEKPTSLVQQLNQGLRMARGQWVARFDADDICEKERLAKQIAFLEDNPGIAVLGTQIRIIDEQGKVVGYRRYPEEHREIVTSLRRFNALAHPSVIYRRDEVVRSGGYRTTHGCPVADYELWSRLARRGVRFANLKEVLISYRIHGAAMKTKKVRRFLIGTLLVKRDYWCREMTLEDWTRVVLEILLLAMPQRLVLRLFMQYQYRQQ